MAEKGKVYSIRDGVTVTEQVLADIAGLAATDVEGVACLNGGLTRENIARAGESKINKAVRVIGREDGSLTVQLIIVTDYNHSIVKVSGQVQEKVKSTIEGMTDIPVSAVDVKVATVNMPKSGK